jgi:hypothetical protein
MIKVPFAETLQLDIGCRELEEGRVAEKRAKSRLPTIAESVVNVFPKPISSARIPPNACDGIEDFLVPTILCS